MSPSFVDRSAVTPAVTVSRVVERKHLLLGVERLVELFGLVEEVLLHRADGR